MKEELKNFMIKNDKEYWNGCDSDHMCKLIDKFFDQYQPERSKREDLSECYFCESIKKAFKDYYPTEGICPKCNSVIRSGALSSVDNTERDK